MKTVLAFLFILSCFATAAHSATPLPPAPAEGYCYDALTSTGYSGVKGCPVTPPIAGRQTIADINYSRSGNSIARNVNVTLFEPVFGRTAPTATPVPFPGVNFFAIFNNFDTSKCISMAFTVPANATTGTMAHDSTIWGVPLLNGSITATPCSAPVSSLCYKNNSNPGTPIMAWHRSDVPGQGCSLTTGVTYYFNVTAPYPYNNGNVVKLGVTNNHN